MFVDILLMLILISMWVSLYGAGTHADGDHRSAPFGLPVSTVVPSFSLPGVDGAITRLDASPGGTCERRKRPEEDGILSTSVTLPAGEDGVILKNAAGGADAITVLAHVDFRHTKGLGK